MFDDKISVTLIYNRLHRFTVDETQLATSNPTHHEADSEHSQRVSSTVNLYSLLYIRMSEILSSNIF
jgi:hypothetical protein